MVATSRSSTVCAHFDQFRVDLSSGNLRKSDGVVIRIQQQPLQVLRLLLEAEGRVITREQLRVALWPEETFVDFEHGVNTAVKKLRQALEDSAENPKFVETLPKVGYRFIAPVEWVADADGEHRLHSVVGRAPTGPIPAPEPIPRKRHWMVMTAIAVAAIGVTASEVSLIYENSSLARTRLGRLLRRAVVVRHAGPEATLSQRRLTANPNDAPLVEL